MFELWIGNRLKIYYLRSGEKPPRISEAVKSAVPPVRTAFS
jgi:hypothetical protein